MKSCEWGLTFAPNASYKIQSDSRPHTILQHSHTAPRVTCQGWPFFGTFLSKMIICGFQLTSVSFSLADKG